MDAYLDQIREEISPLNTKGKVLFAALTCEILYPHYAVFKNETNWGNDQTLLTGIAMLHSYVWKNLPVSIP